MRDRYLFSADRTASQYKHLLEITRTRARLLTPSGRAYDWRWVGSFGILIAWGYLGWGFLQVMLLVWLSLTPLLGWILLAALALCWVVGLFELAGLWDRASLPLLADAPAHAQDLILLGARSFGTFQDVRARVPGGEEMHLVVDARAPRFWEAVSLLEGHTTASG